MGLKTEFKLGEVFRPRTEALLTVKSAVTAYNTIRLHMNCSFMAPDAAHQTTETLIQYWKNNRRKKKEFSTWKQSNTMFILDFHTSQICKVKPRQDHL